MLPIVQMIKNSRQTLGLNHRNAVYIRPYNKSKFKRIADDKLLCKKILSRNNIPTSQIYKVIRNHDQLDSIKWEELPKSFALKPNIGTGGSGIIVVYGRVKNSLEWIRTDGSTLNVNALKNHISKILDGQFSMGNRKDTAFIEERVINDPLLKKYSYKGVPDIRVIVFNRVPIMAELRLPTAESRGAANLHAGGIGVGIDIATGITTVAIHRISNLLTCFPGMSDMYEIIENTLDENQLPISGIQIPHWREILEIAIKCQDVSGLKFLGADIALDRDKGPLVFELNARSGIAIQTANLSGMRDRLERINGLKIKDAEHGIRIAKNLFGGEVEDEIKSISGRNILGLIEKAIFQPVPPTEVPVEEVKKHKKRNRKKRSGFTTIKTKVRINTGIRTSKISPILATRLGFRPALDFFKNEEIPDSFQSRDDARKYLESVKEKLIGHTNIVDVVITVEDDKISIRPVIEIEIELDEENIKTQMIISNRKDMPYSAEIGRNDLKNFLIDTSKTFSLH